MTEMARVAAVWGGVGPPGTALSWVAEGSAVVPWPVEVMFWAVEATSLAVDVVSAALVLASCGKINIFMDFQKILK